MRVCLLGAGAGDITDRQERMVAGADKDEMAMVHAWVNDVSEDDQRTW